MYDFHINIIEPENSPSTYFKEGCCVSGCMVCYFRIDAKISGLSCPQTVKNFFDQGRFPGSMRSLLQSEPSQFTIDTLESSVIIEISFAGYRNLLLKNHDFALFHISYLEKNWVIAKDVREVEIVMEDATERYKKFLDDYPGLQDRIQQYHIASHLGITPTQLSRIRKKNLKNQPM